MVEEACASFLFKINTFPRLFKWFEIERGLCLLNSSKRKLLKRELLIQQHNNNISDTPGGLLTHMSMLIWKLKRNQCQMYLPEIRICAPDESGCHVLSYLRFCSRTHLCNSF